MRQVYLICHLAVLFASACATTQSPRPTSTLVMRGEAGGTVELSPQFRGGGTGTASVGFATGSVCCGIGAFVSGFGQPNDDSSREDQERDDQERDDLNRILGAGLEVTSQVWDHVGFQLRVGAVGTPPDVTQLGRTGFMTSCATVFRLLEPSFPSANEWAPLLELALGVNLFLLSEQRAAIGAATNQIGGTENRFDLMVTLRFGAIYGLDLK